ncbi:MAG: hypothetical protein HY263_10980 [Chloroflexi bacterium]|nr:hypothetical protein [Chloroflexota bacterium]
MSGQLPEPGALPGPDPSSEAGAPAGGSPLAPDASMEDILARMRAMGTAPVDPSAEPAPPPPAPPAPGAPIGGALPPDGPIGWAAPPRPAAKPRRTGLLAGIAAAFAVLIGIGGKLLLGFAVVGVGGQVLGSLFGGPFEKLPQSTRDGFEQRLNAALGPDADKLSTKDYEDRYQQRLVDGLSRLEDGPLIGELQALTWMFDRADTSTCAEAARSEFSSTSATFALSDGMWAQLTQDELTAHIETQVRAIESSAAGAPAQWTVTADQAQPAIDSIFATIGDDVNAVLSDLSSGATRTDEEACTAVRALHDAEIALPPADLALIARYTASP